MTSAIPEPNENSARESRGIQSIEVGGQLLLALAHLGRPAALKDLARGRTAATRKRGAQAEIGAIWLKFPGGAQDLGAICSTS